MYSYESGGRNNFWYSYDSGMVHFISLDTETDLGHGLEGPIETKAGNENGPFGLMNEQVDWLIKDLEAVDREKTPWVIVGLHRPYYTSVDPPTYPAWQEAFEQIFFDYGALQRTFLHRCHMLTACTSCRGRCHSARPRPRLRAVSLFVNLFSWRSRADVMIELSTGSLPVRLSYGCPPATGADLTKISPLPLGAALNRSHRPCHPATLTSPLCPPFSVQRNR